MRLISVFVSFMALVAASVLSVAVIKLRRDLAATRVDLTALRESCQGDRDPLAWQGGDDTWSATQRVPERAAPAPRLAPAALAPAVDPQAAGTPPVASPEMKAELKKLVAEQLADEQRQREAVREQRQQQRQERIAAELGLGPAETERFLNVLGAMQTEWRQIREQGRVGDKTMDDLRPQMAAVRQKTDQTLRELLGEERMQKYESLRGGQRGPGTGAGETRSGPGGR